jgi:ABC-type bacteriocin/lantibiotic exporter with double-glycine peptidase domain
MPPTSQPAALRHSARQMLHLLRLARESWGDLGSAGLLGLGVGALGVAVPYVTKLLIDRVYPRGDLPLLHVLVALLLALSGGAALAGALRTYFGVQLNARLSHGLRLLFFNHLQHLPMRFFDQHQVGEVTSRFQGVSMGVHMLTRLLDTVFTHGVFLLLVPPLLLWLEPRLGLLALTVLPLASLLAAIASRRLRRRWQESSELHADLTAYQVEVLSRIRTFKSMALERRVYAECRRRMRRAARAHLRAAGSTQLLSGLSGLLRASGIAALTWWGWRLVLAGSLTLGDLVAFITYVGYLYTPLFMLVQVYSEFQESAVHVGRMFQYLDEEPEEDPWAVGESTAPPVPRSGFELRGVTLRYPGGRAALEDLDLRLPPGSVTAVVGESGSGKTSLLKLLCALEKPTAGALLFGGREVSRAGPREVRRWVSVVWQEAGLVRGTLRHNLTLGCQDPPGRRRLERVVAECGLTQLVDELPLGLQTPVAEAGASLSAGQQQRIALARALLRDAPVLLLDEATANIDLATERALLDALLERGAGRMVVYVTHRLETARRADRLAVLDGGRLAGLGTHDELMATCRAYRRLWGVAEEGPWLRALGEAG